MNISSQYREKSHLNNKKHKTSSVQVVFLLKPLGRGRLASVKRLLSLLGMCVYYSYKIKRSRD